MGAITSILTGIGLATAAVGTGIQYMQGQEANKAYKEQAAASRQASAASARAEKARERQMNLDADRARRATFRQAQALRATALSRATNANAQNGSALPGSYGQISGELGQSTNNIFQNQSVGQSIFSANYDQFAAQSRGAVAGTQANQAMTGIDFGKSLFSFGANTVSAAPGINSAYTSLFYGNR